jgi:hypothetical protein
MSSAEILNALTALSLDGPAKKWLDTTIRGISLEMLRGADTSTLARTLLGRKWPQNNLTGRQRDGVLSILTATREELNITLILLRNAL